MAFLAVPPRSSSIWSWQSVPEDVTTSLQRRYNELVVTSFSTSWEKNTRWETICCNDVTTPLTTNRIFTRWKEFLFQNGHPWVCAIFSIRFLISFPAADVRSDFDKFFFWNRSDCRSYFCSLIQRWVRCLCWSSWCMTFAELLPHLRLFPFSSCQGCLVIRK